MRFLILVGLLSASLFAQIDQLATTASGNDVLFVTNRLRQAGSDQDTQYQLFRLAAGGLTLLDGNQRQLEQPSISADGTAVVTNWIYFPPRNCFPIFGQPCGSVPSLLGQQRYRLDYPGGVASGEGAATVTPNGRYLVVLKRVILSSDPLQFKVTVNLVNVSSGGVVLSGAAPAAGGQFAGRLAANDGSLLVRSGSTLQLIRPSGTVDFPGMPLALRLDLAGDASAIAYETFDSRIGLIDVASGQNRIAGPGIKVALADNGTLASYMNHPDDPRQWPRQIWVADPASGATRLLATIEEGLMDQTVSGDGLTVIASTQTGRIVKIDVKTGTVTELVAATGPTMGLIRSAVPGSYNELAGPIGLTPDLADVHLTVDGHAAPVLGTTPRGIAVQVPWEARVSPDTEVVLRLKDSRFQELVPAPVIDHYVYFLPLAQDSLAGPYYFAYHQDWKSPVKGDNPAQPDEIIHMYSMGWGPVNGNLKTGQPTPTDRPYLITAPCQWSAYASDAPGSAGEPLETLFSGLAPGLTGLFQQDFRVPADWSSSQLLVACPGYFGPDRVFAVPTQP